MRQHVLILYPQEASYVGLWLPQTSPEWVVRPVDRSESLFRIVNTLLQEHTLTIKQITHIGIMHGPAPYTQLRSLVAAANSLAWALHVPIFSFAPNIALPDAIPELLTKAQVNVPIEPRYPAEPR